MTATLNIRKPKLERKIITTRKMKNVTFDTFQLKVRSEKQSCDGLIEIMAENINIELR